MQPHLYVAAMLAAPLSLAACVHSDSNPTDGPVTPVKPLLCVVQGALIVPGAAALPPGLTVTVKMIDRDVMDGPAPPYGAFSFTTDGGQPPYRFAVSHDCDYRVRASTPTLTGLIEDGDGPLYANREHVFVGESPQNYRIELRRVR